MPISKSIGLFAISATVLFSAGNFAQDGASPEQLMHERHENFEKIGESFKAIRDEVRSSSADLALISSSATTINDLAQQIHTWFPAGTGPESGIETEAKAEIWQDKAGFNAAAENLVDESGKFLALTTSGDIAKIGGGVRSLGGACKNCHDDYRVDDD